MKIYHNPRCSKSRETLQLIEANGGNVEIIEYLETPPTEDEIKSILKKLGMKAEEIVRKTEDLYKQSFKGKVLSEEQWIKILAENPVLIERPIVVKGNRAVLGRPPENVYGLL